ncbi:MAG: GAF domain-containing protein [Verrucomicrobiales bacterium]|nr:GAF domain-containing protein [Verrucomicrobiales bacterium]
MQIDRQQVTRLRSRAAWIVICYALFATLWILFSDHIMGLMVADPARLVQWSLYKGLAFVGVTSLLLLLLMHRAFGALEKGYTFLQSQQAEIERLNRLYSALSHISQAIVRTQTPDELFQKLCGVLVKEGGFGMAWVGWQETESYRITPVAVAGDDSGYIQTVEVYADDRAEGRGPSGIAVRTGEPFICHDLLVDPAVGPWRAEIVRRAFRTSAAFPIFFGGKVAGVLNVYSKVPGFFQDREIALLKEAVVDVSYALDHLAREKERQRAEDRARNERLFSDSMIESMPGVVYLADDRGRLLRWNRNLQTIAGYSAEEIARMKPSDFLVPAERSLLETHIAEVFAGGESSVELPFLDRSGRSVPFFFTGRRVVFEGTTCLVAVGIDISERKAAEMALRVINETLELEVTSRTAELKLALARAESADRIKSAFLATMSHELRTPLNSIIGFTGIILQELAGPLNPEQSKQLGMVRGSARHLLELINDVLDISKIEAGQLEVRNEAFDLVSVVESAVGSVRPFAEKKGLILSVVLPPSPTFMVSDRRRVEQILLNLLNNAIKFTEAGRVSLTIGTIMDFRRSGDSTTCPVVQMIVSDTGIGIKPDDLPLLFQPFRQLDTGMTRHHDGTGLGLAICSRLCALLGGEIAVRSAWQTGSDFTVVLPLGNPCQP